MGTRFPWRPALLAFGLGQAVAATYVWTFRGMSYSRSFVLAVAIGSIISCTLMLAINNSIAAGLGIADGERVLVSSPRGSVEMGVRVQPDIPAGLTFTTFHFPDLVDINLITNDEWDRDSGTAEFKAAAIRVEKLRA